MTQEIGPSSLPSSSVLVHSVLVGLTPLIPVPLLDDYVKGVIERRLVASVGVARGVVLPDADVSALVDEEGGGLGGIAKGIATFPLKLIFRKIFFVLEVKRASDAASLAYHRGYLVDRALERSILAPSGPRSAREVRAAIDRSCETVSISPLAQALSGAFSASAGVLEGLGKDLLAKVTKSKGKLDDADVAHAVDQTSSRSDFMDRARAALNTVPKEHFEALDRAFDEALQHPTSPK